MKLSRQQFWVLVLLTLVWGINWPAMKLGISGTPAAPAPYPPLTFRARSMVLGVPVLALGLVMLKVPFAIPRKDWGELVRLTLPNMIVWHVVIILALAHLSSGRAAILGYTMPIFSALIGLVLFGQRLAWRQTLGVAAAALGVALLLAHEFGRLSGAPAAAAAMLLAAAVWALGTHMLRGTKMQVPTLAISFWMTALTAVLMVALAAALERDRWAWPPAHTGWAIVYNAVGVFGFAHAAWFYLARGLPHVASSISVMMIPVLGVFSGAWVLGEVLHWQDFAAVALIVVAIALVLLGKR